MEFSRQEYWSGVPCPPPGDLPDPGIKPVAPALQADSLLLSHQGSPTFLHNTTEIKATLKKQKDKGVYLLILNSLTLLFLLFIPTVIFKMDNQQGPTVQHMELCSVLRGNLDGKAVWGKMSTVHAWLSPLLCQHCWSSTLQYKIKCLKTKKIYNNFF